ncbi:MAG: hypothetical protein ACON4O_05525 [Lentimonas sp.]
MKHPPLRSGLRHLRAVALRLPFGTILDNQAFEAFRGLFYVREYLRRASLNCLGRFNCDPRRPVSTDVKHPPLRSGLRQLRAVALRLPFGTL